MKPEIEEFIEQIEKMSKEERIELINNINSVKIKVTKTYTPLCKELDPNIIFERGFLTKNEFDSVDLFQVIDGHYRFLVKALMIDGNEREGLWVALISKEDRELYDNNWCGEIKAILLNDCLLLNGGYLRVITGNVCGEERPKFKVQDQNFELNKDDYEKEGYYITEF